MSKKYEHARIMPLENPTGYGRIIEKEGKFEKIGRKGVMMKKENVEN